MEIKETIKRSTLLYKTGVEYGDYTINHVQKDWVTPQEINSFRNAADVY